MYQAEGCGICRKPGADSLWFSPFSRGAHSKCLELVKPYEAKARNYLDENFDRYDSNMAHVEIIKHVQYIVGHGAESFGVESTIKAFIEQDDISQRFLHDAFDLAIRFTKEHFEREEEEERRKELNILDGILGMVDELEKERVPKAE